ncbi:DOPA 4,5-dioxygenase family protein, partial [Pseudomonas brassicae]|uniref:DOPA 4,5-dioxygenase family protein n=1 Tax=Pseudomonas brassicae TaxID=2708063 RepID=UPI003082C0A0
MQRIKGYHAHVYYDASTLEQARELCEEATKLFGVSMGRLHQKPVGPHPDWSCQLAFGPELVGVVLPWLALYRKGLGRPPQPAPCSHCRGLSSCQPPAAA